MSETPAVELTPTSAQDFYALRTLFDDPSFAGWGGLDRMSDDVLRQKYLGRRFPHVECFMVLLEGQPVGLAQCHAAEGGEAEGGLDLILLPTVRREGVGRTVVSALIEHARDRREWRRVTVDPDLTNTDGIRFWRALGFEPVRHVPATRERQSFLLMARALP